MRDRTGKSPSTRPSATPNTDDDVPGLMAHAEGLYRTGHHRELLAAVHEMRRRGPSQDVLVRADILEGMATFDAGNVVASLRLLAEAVERSRRLDTPLHFAAALALFLRDSDFQSPDEVLPGLTSLRQLASRIGDANALAGLHLGVARLEGLRGHCAGAHRHLEIARRFAERSNDVGLQCCVDNVEASLESIAGNFGRSRRLAQACFKRADAAGFVKYTIGSVANLAVVDLYTGQLAAARERLDHVLGQAQGLTYVQLGALDSLASIALREGRLEACAELLGQCAAVIATDAVPAPSWNDLAHRVTRCSYLEHFADWTAIVQIVDGVDGELQRRQYKALRTSLLCARARALARQQQPDAAQATLAIAMRTCPKGAVDPGIVLEASKGLCLAARGDWDTADVHYGRAIAACRAIGHDYHHWWIERDRHALARSRRGAGARPRRSRDLGDTALLLSDVANIVANAQSMDLLVQSVVSVLEGTSLGGRMRVERQDDAEAASGPAVAWSLDPAGTCLIRLRRGEDRVAIRCDGVESLEEISLMKSLSDLLQTAARQTANADAAEDDLSLWPGGTAAARDDTVFRSPQMLELLRIAERLAATNVPILITGETGTGKDVLARFIHERSRVARETFMPFNCASIPRELVESQLFGHRRGAFTGAVDASVGVIRSAQGGTLFLDEVGELEPAIQPKLLRFLESGEIHPVGELRPQRVTVRVVAATNTDLEQLAEEGRFRRDLFYRLGAARLALPPLRERKDEIPALAALFLARDAKECRRAGLRLGDDFIAALLLHDWPGNIRQLSNEIRRVVAMASDGQTLGASDLAPNIMRVWNARPVTIRDTSAPRIEVRLDQPLAMAVDDLERKFIEHALSTSGGRVAEAAQLLGVSRKGLFLKRRRRGFIGQ